MHWGREYRPRMNGLQRRIATYLTSLGVHVIIGSHPHVMQPYSYRDKRFVAYSLGNLLFSHEWTPEKFRVGYCLYLFFLFFLHCDIRLNLQRTTIGSLSKGVFERRTSTGSEVFSLLTCLDDIKFVFLSFFTVIEAI